MLENIDQNNSDYEKFLLHTILPKTSTYVKSYDGQNKWLYFLIEDDDLQKKCNTLLGNVRSPA